MVFFFFLGKKNYVGLTCRTHVESAQSGEVDLERLAVEVAVEGAGVAPLEVEVRRRLSDAG